jgi:hypothetical protein|eukprot:SAG25_NODE_701_length_5875_cov_2.089681_3_plen_91_part_00
MIHRAQQNNWGIINLDNELGSFDNSASQNRWNDAGLGMSSISDGWHRLTVAALCSSDSCALRQAVYFIDGTERGRSNFTSETGAASAASF